jgi:hypothetical protein
MLKLIWKSYKMSRTGQVTAELIKVGGEISRLEIYKLIHSIWNNEELSLQRKEFIICPTCTKGDKNDCSNCRRMSLLPTTDRFLSNSLLSTLTP